MGGQEEELRAKSYRARIRSLEDPSAHVIQAIGIPSISEDITDVKVDNLNSEKSLLRRGNGHIELLIGIDQAKLYTEGTREAGNVVARHSLLGWVVFGAVSWQAVRSQSSLPHQARNACGHDRLLDHGKYGCFCKAL